MLSFPPDELFCLPFHLAAKPMTDWSTEELHAQLEIYEAKKQLRGKRSARNINQAEMDAISTMQTIKLNMMSETVRRLHLMGQI